MYILGLSFFYHDSAACLIKDGVIIAAAEEERFTRKKHDPFFPNKAISFCLKEAGITMQDIEYVVFYEKPILKFERILFSYLKAWPRGFLGFYKALPLWLGKKIHVKKIIRKELGFHGKILFVKHHDAHAASAFYCSPFERAAIVTMDGIGEWATTVISKGDGSRIIPLREMHFPDSLGLLYSAFTYFLGFAVNDGEYKIMGLAPYGEQKYVSLIKEKMIQIFSDGSFRLNRSFFMFETGDEMINRESFEKVLGIKKRDPREEILQEHKDCAASIQKIVEDVIVAICNEAQRATGEKNICLAGGVALNCVANSKIASTGVFNNMFVFPAAGDSGGAVGAALFAWHHVLGNGRSGKGIKNVFWGPDFSGDHIGEYLERIHVKYEKLSEKDLIQKVTERLCDQKIVGWFQGRMEFGPRALGNRSILADPRKKENWDKINRVVKFREDFRPFAPAVLKEKAQQFFDFPHPESPFMTFVARSKTEKIPAVTHVDGSARIQTVSFEENALFYGLISEFSFSTGIPVLINTSFNLSGEPIVRTPQDAFRVFMLSGIDVLVLKNFLIFKENIPWGRRFE